MATPVATAITACSTVAQAAQRCGLYLLALGWWTVSDDPDPDEADGDDDEDEDAFEAEASDTDEDFEDDDSSEEGESTESHDEETVEALEELENKVRAVASGVDSKSRWLRDLAIYDGYHDSLLNLVTRMRRGEELLTVDERNDPDISFRGFLDWCAGHRNPSQRGSY